MNNETQDLYRLMILYMLSKSECPLSNNQISNFMLNKKYATYFPLQEALHNLENEGYILTVPYQNTTHYIISDKGDQTADFFNTGLSVSIRQDIDSYLTENKFNIRSDSYSIADYHVSNGEYIIRLRILEGTRSLTDISIRVPDESIAVSMCSKWKQHDKDIYEYIMKTLL